MNKMIIRQEETTDYPQVNKLYKLAFNRDDEANLVNAIRKNPNIFFPFLSIVAVLDAEVLGHILYSKIEINHSSGQKWESLALAPMAVQPDYQNQGIGAKLITEGLNVAARKGFKSVIVLGHPTYYPRFGFRPAANWNIKSPFKVPSNAFMAVELIEQGLKDISGTVIYPKEFEGL